MKNYVYIRAYFKNGDLSFRSVKLEADGKDDAYYEGSKLIPMEETPNAVNDYVVEI